jgi:hypothetical protein
VNHVPCERQKEDFLALQFQLHEIPAKLPLGVLLHGHQHHVGQYVGHYVGAAVGDAELKAVPVAIGCHHHPIAENQLGVGT